MVEMVIILVMNYILTMKIQIINLLILLPIHLAMRYVIHVMKHMKIIVNCFYQLIQKYSRQSTQAQTCIQYHNQLNQQSAIIQQSTQAQKDMYPISQSNSEAISGAQALKQDKEGKNMLSD